MKCCVYLASVAVIFFPLLPEVCGSDSQKENPLKAVELANADFAKVFSNGDQTAVANMYTEQARLLPPNADVVEGKKEIEKFWKGVMDIGIREIELRTREVESFGDTIIEQGAATLYCDGNVVFDSGKYFVMWKRINNKWKLHRDCWNSSKPMAPKQCK